MTELILELWTDGSGNNKTGLGSWAFAGVINNGVVHQEFQSYHSTTSNRMEMMAAIEALRWARESVPEFIPVHYSDSQYLLNIPTWAKKWEMNGWKTANKKPVKNKDLVKRLLTEVTLANGYTSVWVKGHAGVPMNEHVDALATQAVAEMRPIEDVRREAKASQSKVEKAAQMGAF